MSVACLGAATIAGVMIITGTNAQSEVEEHLQQAKAQDPIDPQNTNDSV